MAVTDDVVKDLKGRIDRSLDDPDLMSDQLRADAGLNNLSGVGVSESPRGAPSPRP